MGKFARFAATSGQPKSVEKARTVPAEATQSPPEDKPKTTDLDPRPDLVEDHRDWMAVLVVAKTEDLRLRSLLHGLRCVGARLELRDGANGLYYRIDYKPLLDVWDEQKLRKRWLEPHRHQIKRVLDQALTIKLAADRSFAEKKATEGTEGAAVIEQKEYRQASLWGESAQ